jgi:hypothetical protein
MANGFVNGIYAFGQTLVILFVYLTSAVVALYALYFLMKILGLSEPVLGVCDTAHR